jgi:hypothetical protein
MAEKRKEDGVPSSFRGDIKQLEGLRKLSSATVHGGSEDFYRQNSEDADRVREAVQATTRKVRKQVGSDITDFFSAVNYSSGDKAAKDEPGKQQKKLVDIEKMVGEAEEKGLNELLMAEKERFVAYGDFRRIVDMIPQMSQAVRTYVDNIMSPDDFTKNSVVLSYDGEGLDEPDRAQVEENLEHLRNKYQLDERAPKVIKNAMIDGDHFLAVVKLKKDIDRMLLSESGPMTHTDQFDSKNRRLYKQTFLSESFFRHDLSPLRESFVEQREEGKEEGESWGEVLGEGTRAMSEILNDNLLVSNDPSTLVLESVEMNDAFGAEDLNDPFSKKKKKEEKLSTEGLTGSVIRTLEPERVVKLEDNGVCYGYIYFEPVASGDAGDLGGYATTSTSLANRDAMGKLMSVGEKDTAKRKMIYNVFVKGVARRMGKDVLAKNKHFAEIVHAMLRQEFILKKKVRVTYFSPREVQHFGDDSGNSTYYDSIFRSVVFSAKLYIAILTSTLMHRLVRAPSKRLFYIEVGLDQDDGAAVNSFIRDVKSKEIKVDDISGDINNMMSLIGTFNDIYVPTIENQKPINECILRS